jgi:hypothetical protein
LGRFNTPEEVDYTVGRIVEEVRRLRDLAPLYKAHRAKLQRLRQIETNVEQQVS